VDSVGERELLEDLIETTKPPMPPECRGLHDLLSTPFRYGAVYPTGSRFRRAGLTEGIFYASEKLETAVAEMAFYRLLFFAESPNTPWPTNPAEYTAFATAYSTRKAIDLTRGQYRAFAAQWTHPSDYTHSQALAETARAAKVEIIAMHRSEIPARE
jgi:RES domain